jgi:two-component system cell cycle sensor histidine kinase/response regulator CckA
MVRKLVRGPTGAWSLRVYFALLFALVVGGSLARVAYLDHEAGRDARRNATQDARFSATAAAEQLDNHVALLKATAAGLAANAQIARVFDNPGGCTLSFEGIGGPDRSHLDIIRADGTVACSSRKLKDDPPGSGYGKSAWLPNALRRSAFLAPVRDDLVGGQVAIASAPIPGGRGFVAAFSDLGALGPHLASIYGGGRPTDFLVLTADHRTVVARSKQPSRWIGTQLAPTHTQSKPGSEWRDLDGVSRLYAHTSAQKAGWNIYVGEQKSSVLASVTRLRVRQLKLMGIGMLLFLLAAALVYHRVASPLRRLSRAVRAAREDDAHEPFSVSGAAEVQTLAEDVNALTASVHRELHERRRAEESYRLLFEGNPSPMWVFDAETHRFLAVNDAAIAAYGYSRDEFVALAIEDIRSPEEVSRLNTVLADRELDSGLRSAGIWRHKRKDGTEFDAEINSHDHRFEGRAARVVIALDVTERVQAERALRRSEARYRDLFENASDLIVTGDLDGRLTAVNETCLRALGYSREEMAGIRIDMNDFIARDKRAQSVAARGRKVADTEATTVYESELVAKDGRRIQVEIASRLIIEDGVPVGTEAICRDISERKQLEEQLRQGQRLEAIGRLAGGVAHDFNNLLTVISGYAEVLLDGRDRAAEPELDQIAAAAERAAILTRQLLAFSRRQVLQPRVLQLNDVVEGLTPMLSRLIGEDVELVATLAPSLGPVHADPNQLEQVLVNLAVNARDAMPEGGLLTIRTANVELDYEYVAHHGDAVVGPHVMLSVSDTGVGMDEETLSHIFEPFFTTKPLGIGTGLGLSTVYGIVRQSGGSMWVYSEPGHGTTFKALLPRAESPAGKDARPTPNPAAAGGSETILLAEDEESLRRLTARILEQQGYEVIAAETATEAAQIAERNGRKIDLLLTDLVMPELSGSALAERVCKLLPDVRVLFMSGYSDEVVTRNGTLTPGSAFLEKPFSGNELAAKVRETLDARPS